MSKLITSLRKTTFYLFGPVSMRYTETTQYVHLVITFTAQTRKRRDKRCPHRRVFLATSTAPNHVPNSLPCSLFTLPIVASSSRIATCGIDCTQPRAIPSQTVSPCFSSRDSLPLFIYVHGIALFRELCTAGAHGLRIAKAPQPQS